MAEYTLDSLQEELLEIASSDELPAMEKLEALREAGKNLLSLQRDLLSKSGIEWLNGVLPTVLAKLGLPSDLARQPIPFERNGMPGNIAFFFGRESEKERIDAWANDSSKRILEIVGGGGYGKTQLVNNWLLERFSDRANQSTSFEAVFCWCFYTYPNRARYGYNEFVTNAIQFFERLLRKSRLVANVDRQSYLVDLMCETKCLVVLDGLEALQKRVLHTREELEDGDESLMPGQFRRRFASMKSFLNEFASRSDGKLIITSRQPLSDLSDSISLESLELRGLDLDSAVKTLRQCGVRGSDTELTPVAESLGFHPLTLGLFGYAIGWHFEGIPSALPRIRLRQTDLQDETEVQDRQIIRSYQKWLRTTPEMELLRLTGFFSKLMIQRADLELLASSEDLAPITQTLRESIIDPDDNGLNSRKLNEHLSRLKLGGLIFESTQTQKCSGTEVEATVYDVHPLLRNYFREQLAELTDGASWQVGQSLLFDHYNSLVPGAASSKEEVRVLYEAIGYACEAERFADAFDTYWRRVHRNEHAISSDRDWYSRPSWYAREKLGLFAEDLSALGWFFERPWQKLRAKAKEQLNQDQENIIRFSAADCLKALGHTIEAGHPISSIRGSFESRDQRRFAAITAGWECERRLLQGRFDDAKSAAVQALKLAEMSGDQRQMLSKKGRMGDCCMQVGEWVMAAECFDAVVELHLSMQRNSERPLDSPIGGYTGFLFGEFMLTRAEITLADWDRSQTFLVSASRTREQASCDLENTIEFAQRFIDRAESQGESKSDIVLHEFLLLKAQAVSNVWHKSTGEEQVRINDALKGLQPRFEEYARGDLPRLLIKRSKVLRRLQFMTGLIAGGSFLQEAYQCLTQAIDLAQDGDQLLYEADILLEQAKVFDYEARLSKDQTEKQSAYAKATETCNAAKTLIQRINYRKRLPELSCLESQLKAGIE